MKVVVYSTRPYEKEALAKANHKKHDITLISNSLTEENTFYAKGKDAVLVNINDDVTETIINGLASFGIKFISTRSYSIDHINQEAARKAHLKIGRLSQIYNYTDEILAFSVSKQQEIAEETIHNLDQWQENKCLGKNCIKNCQPKTDYPETPE
jgi:D-lactate dehydrogenase